MKIAFVGQKGIPGISGGVEKHVADVSTRLVKLGHEVIVYTRPNYTSKNLKEYQGVKLISLPTIATKHLDAISHTFLACLDLIFRKKVDVIHFHSIGPSSLIWLVKLFKPRTPVIFTFHSKCYLHQKWGKMARWYLQFSEYLACRFADQTIAVSYSLAQHLKEKYDIEAAVIPNGAVILPAAEPNLINTWDLARGNYILSVSRLVRVKGLHFLISAYKELSADKKLVIVGAGSEHDAYEEELKALAIDNPNIIFTGQQTGKILEELFANCYFFVQPSESEGMSISLLEAMSYGKGVLASNIAENLEAASDSGFYFESRNVKDFKNKMAELMDNPELLRIKGDLAKKRIIEYYNWDNITEQIVGLYKDYLLKNSDKELVIAKSN